mmetsp:Transcript_64536/g.120105  ORF Transcript_64536/g.120105 Transcript_64536/m.120105 type:complete len:479 (-) Transcript_64536:62-1498(-)
MESVSDGSEAFVTFGRGVLKVFNAAKNFGFINPVFKPEDSEGPPLPASCDEGVWFFGNHSLSRRAVPGLELTFEIWENSQGKAQARSVQVAAEPTLAPIPEAKAREVVSRRDQGRHMHPNEPRVIYPSVYVSDVPVEWNENAIRKLHRQLGLNPDTIMGLKFLPFTEVSLGANGQKGGGDRTSTPVTGAVILRYLNEEAANAGVERLRGHPIQTSNGVTKHLGAKHATPPKWVVERKQAEEDERQKTTSRGEAIMQKVRGYVVRVSMAGYGVIKSPDWGEVMWRQYELPTNLRVLQFTDKVKFTVQVEQREEYKRLKDIEGKEVEAELYKLPDGQVRASHVRAMLPPGAQEAVSSNAGFPDGMPDGLPMPTMPPGMPDGPPGALPMPTMPPGAMPMPGMPDGRPPGMPEAAHMQMMQMMQMMQGGGKKEKKKDKKEKKEKKEKKRQREAASDAEDGNKNEEEEEVRAPKKRIIDDDDF